MSNYICETVIAGDVIEKKKYFAPRCPGMKLQRRKNEKKTSDEQWVINERRSIKNLYYLILTNFKREDIRLDLTYREPEPTPEEAKEHFNKFIRKVREIYKKLGHALKWIATTEHDGHRIHHHILLNNVGLTRADYDKLWPHSKLSYKSFRYYDGEAEDADRVSKYLVKETRETFCKADAIQKRRWTSSRNLQKPIIKKEIIQSKKWTDRPKAVKGYYVQQPIKSGYTPYGYPYQWYRMIRIREGEESETHKKKRRAVSSKKKSA